MLRLAFSPDTWVKLRASPVDSKRRLFVPWSQACGSSGIIPFYRFWVVSINPLVHFNKYSMESYMKGKHKQPGNNIYFYRNHAELQLSGSTGSILSLIICLNRFSFFLSAYHTVYPEICFACYMQNNFNIYFKSCGFLNELIMSHIACLLEACTSSFTLPRDLLDLTLGFAV